MNIPRNIAHTETFRNKAEKIPRESYISPRFPPKVQRNGARRQKTRYESQLPATRSSANLFKYFKAFRKEKIPSDLKWGKEEAHSDAEKAVLFSDFFDSTYKTSSKFEEPISQDMFCPKFENVKFMRHEISNICSQLSVTKSKGPDNLPPILFREVSDHISASLFQILKKVSEPQPFLQFGKKLL